MISHKTVLCLGSNCGDRKKTLENALTVIRSIAESVKASEMYETPAVADASSTAFAKHPYVNMVVEAETSLTLHDLGIKLKETEIEAGRDDECRKLGLVPLDMDIIVFDSKILRPRDYAQSFFRIGLKQLKN